jgi:hypothetical protein
MFVSFSFAICLKASTLSSGRKKLYRFMFFLLVGEALLGVYNKPNLRVALAFGC